MAPVLTDLIPLNDFVLLTPAEVPAYHTYRRFAHIVVPEKYEHGPEDRPVWGTVVAKGPQCTQTPIVLGSRVVIGKWEGARLQHEGQPYILVKESSILAVDG